MAGGKNVIDDVVGPDDPKYRGMINVEPELIVKENPQYILEAVASWGDGGYETDDITKMIASKEQVLNRTELANVDAVKNDRVYCLDYFVLSGAGNNIIGAAYMAKLFYPDLFKDIDPEAIHQEYIDKFCRIDFDVKNHGAFVYPKYDDWPVKIEGSIPP
jgi:iron complex transport system substrate-binding protein